MNFEVQEEVETLNPYESFFTSKVPGLSIRYVEEESGNMVVSLSRSVEPDDEDMVSSKNIELTFGPEQREDAGSFFREAREKLEGYRDGDEERGVTEITAMFESKESEME